MLFSLSMAPVAPLLIVPVVPFASLQTPALPATFGQHRHLRIREWLLRLLLGRWTALPRRARCLLAPASSSRESRDSDSSAARLDRQHAYPLRLSIPCSLRNSHGRTTFLPTPSLSRPGTTSLSFLSVAPLDSDLDRPPSSRSSPCCRERERKFL